MRSHWNVLSIRGSHVLFLTQSFTQFFFQAPLVTKINHSVYFKISLYFSSICVAFTMMLSLYHLRIKLMYFLYFFSILQLMYKNVKEMALSIHLWPASPDPSLVGYIPIYNDHHSAIAVSSFWSSYYSFFLCIFAKVFWGKAVKGLLKFRMANVQNNI